MGTKGKSRPRIDPAPRLFMVLVRYSLGWFEQRQLAAELDVAPSQVSMWERGERPIPLDVLEATAALANVSQPLLALALRAIRSFLQASKGRGGAGRDLAVVAALDLLSPLLEAMEVVLSPLQSPAGEPEDAQALWARLERRTPAERLLIVEEGEEYQTRALHERVLAESATLAATRPGEARELAQLAARIGELAGSRAASLRGRIFHECVALWRVPVI